MTAPFPDRVHRDMRYLLGPGPTPAVVTLGQNDSDPGAGPCDWKRSTQNGFLTHWLSSVQSSGRGRGGEGARGRSGLMVEDIVPPMVPPMVDPMVVAALEGRVVAWEVPSPD